MNKRRMRRKTLDYSPSRVYRVLMEEKQRGDTQIKTQYQPAAVVPATAHTAAPAAVDVGSRNAAAISLRQPAGMNQAFATIAAGSAMFGVGPLWKASCFYIFHILQPVCCSAFRETFHSPFRHPTSQAY